MQKPLNPVTVFVIFVVFLQRHKDAASFCSNEYFPLPTGCVLPVWHQRLFSAGM